MIICGDSKEVLNNFTEVADLIVTSPPYADARSKHYDSIHPDKYVEWFMSFSQIFAKALNPDGSLIINIKDKIVDGVRHRYVWDTIQALSNDGWYCIEDYIWNKPNPMPGYWPTRLRDGWEYCFHLSRTKKPYINQEAVKIPIGSWSGKRLINLSDNDKTRRDSMTGSGVGKNISNWVGKNKVLPTNVINSAVEGKNKKHPAAFPESIPTFFIKLLSREKSLIIDPFAGSGTTGVAALKLNRKYVLIDNNQTYCDIAKERIEILSTKI